ncbi:alpha-1,2-fucosyltransferase [Salinibacter ruber]|uniref:alpha-1,2-fucosyltransferase n=1 Tax=Salinibacter ruber TaxID=146919 RepID=UPI002072CE81|nr:alpha-1,2-fucosyltransferase [Salinibacter ruber]
MDELFAKYRRSFDKIVGVHIRHGDYKKWESGRHFFETDAYVEAVKKSVLASHTKTLIIVVSDTEIPEGIFTETPCVQGPGTEIGDLYTLSKCDAIVGPLSTFNLWASFFGEVPRYEMRRSDSGLGAVPVGASKDLSEIVIYAG